MWEIALLIATVVGAVHFVHRYAFKQGFGMGRAVGRKEILEENAKRSDAISHDHTDMMKLVDQIVDAEEARFSRHGLNLN